MNTQLKPSKILYRNLLFFILLQLSAFALSAQIQWPADQLLPSFPRTAQTQDLIILRVGPNLTADEMPLFASLKGVVNKTEPRIFSYEGDQFAEGRYTWLESLGLDYNEISNNWELISKYRDEIGGIIVYDDAQPHTMNLASTLAERQDALVAAPGLVQRLTSAPFNLPILEDLRGRFNSKLAVYQTLYNDYWPQMNKRMLVGLSPQAHKAALREYVTALGAPTIWLDPENGAESQLLNRFLGDMPDDAVYMGWWPAEAIGIERASTFGIATVPSDYCSNLTIHSGMSREINIKATPPKPPLRNKLYVAFNYSDGDNLQFVEHLMRKLWSNPDRGTVPIGWTVSPAMVDAMPGALNYFYESGTDNDNLISGPSGYGYVYPNSFPDDASLTRFVKKTEEYNKLAGIKVTTIWNTITGGIDADVGRNFARNAPSLLGLTAQNTGGGLTIYNNSMPGLALECNYCTNEQSLRNHIGYGSEGWDGNSPRFILIQAQPWQGITPTNFKNVANGLNSDYEVVRPDQLFQLLREYNGLPIDPTGGLSDPPEGFTAWRSHNFPNRHIRHRDSRARIDANISPEAAAYWKMVPGLAGQGVSFQSRNFPNRYLRHRGSEVWMDPLADNALYWADATFYRRSGLADNNKVSFESYNFPGNYIRHRGSLLYSEAITNGTARQDATWQAIGDSGDDGGDGGGGNGGFSSLIEAENHVVANDVQNEPCSEGGQNVGFLNVGSWMVYDINIPSSGSYLVEYRVASLNGGGQIQLEQAGGARQYGTVNVPNTGGWQNWTTVSHTVALDAGPQQIAIYVPAAGYNINWLKVSVTANAAVATASGLTDEALLTRLVASPVPVGNTLNVSGLTAGLSFVIYDVGGKVVLEGETESVSDDVQIDVSEFSGGIYILKESETGKSIKFTKN